MEVRVGDALASLRAWPLEDKIDLVFIDADKGGYAAYYEAVLGRGLLAPGGVIAIDNTLFKGAPRAAASKGGADASARVEGGADASATRSAGTWARRPTA